MKNSVLNLSTEEQVQLVDLLEKYKAGCKEYLSSHEEHESGYDEAGRQSHYAEEIIDLIILSWR